MPFGQNEKNVRKLLNAIGFALADENVGNRAARREAVLAHRELLDMLEDAPALAPPPGGGSQAGGGGAANARIAAAIPRVADIAGVA